MTTRTMLTVWCRGERVSGRGVMGLCLSSQTWGTQDKRNQSKGDVEVMKTKALRGRELLGAAVILSTSDPLPPSSTACRINWPHLYGNLTPHEHTKHTHISVSLSIFIFFILPSVQK